MRATRIVLLLAVALSGCASPRVSTVPTRTGPTKDWPGPVWGPISSDSTRVPALAEAARKPTVVSVAVIDIDARSVEQIAADRGTPGVAVSPSFWLKLVSIFKGRIRILCYEKVVQ